MKRIISFTLCICLILALSACGKKKTAEYSMGLGLVGRIGGEEGEGNFTGTVATVVTDSDGKIVECRLDAIENEVDIDNGTLDRDDINEEFETKQEKGNDYGMKEASSIDREWYEQADYFADYVEGLNSEEVSAIGANKEAMSDQLILSGCTIDISDFIKAIVLACNDEHKKKFKSSEFKLGLGVYSKISNESGEGSIKLESVIGAAAVNKSGEAIAVLVDTVEPEIKYTAAGTVTNKDSNVVTKKSLGDGYGMKGASKIGREWYEQAAAFEDFLAGIDATGVNSIMLTDDKKAEDDILRAGCTIAIDGFMHAVYKAINYAK